MKRKQPILVLLVAGVLFVAGLVNFRQQQISFDDAEAWSLRDREMQVVGYLDVAKEMGQADKWDELEAVLLSAREKNLIDFFALQTGPNLVWFGQRNKDASKIPLDIPVGGAYRTDGENGLIASAVQVGIYKVSIGIERNASQFAMVTDSNGEKVSRKDQLMQLKRKLFAEQLIYFAAIVFLCGLWTLRDIMAIVKRVRSGNMKDLTTVKTMSSESDLFMRGLNGYAQSVAELQMENQKLGRQVLPSLKKEITSGKAPPYDFYCTMVRTDINNFSLIYNSHNVTEFMSTINDFFKEVSLCVARYNGLVHEFVGDEVIFYFKDDDHTNSFAIALSAVRDIGKIAERYHVSTVAARGYPFTVKSSLSHGRVRFGPLVNGFTVAGSVLIETVRILSHIQEKEENVVYYDGVNHPKVADVIEGEERLRVKLKGFHDEKSLYQYVAHQELDAILQNLDLKSVEKLLLYRDDVSLQLIIENLRSKMKVRDLTLTLRATQILRQPYIAESTVAFGETLADWIEEIREWFNADLNCKAEKLLSSVEMLFLNLVVKESFTDRMSTQLKALLAFTDKRVVANALEVLTYFETAVDTKLVKRFEKDDLRVMANAMVHESRDEILPSTIKKIAALLRSKDGATVASALYVVGEVARTHRERDFVYYATQVDFLVFVKSLDSYVQHPNAMVRRQAFVAARKCADEAVLEAIRTAVAQADSDLLNEEKAKYLDQNRLRHSA